VDSAAEYISASHGHVAAFPELVRHLGEDAWVMLQVCVNTGQEFPTGLAETFKDSVPETAPARSSYNTHARVLFADLLGLSPGEVGRVVVNDQDLVV
jgi:hypothetical protein